MVVRRGASANAAAAGNFAWNASRHEIAGNLTTTARTLEMNGNKLMCARLYNVLIVDNNSCTFNSHSFYFCLVTNKYMYLIY